MRKQIYNNNIGFYAEIYENGDIYAEDTDGNMNYIGTRKEDWDEEKKLI